MARVISPPDMAPPAGLYSHGMAVAGPGGTWLHIAGQVGIAPDGLLAEGFEAQAQHAWRNLVAVLAEAGMDVSHLVKVTTYVTDAADLPRLAPVRSGFLGAARPASTVVVALALAQPAWRVEIEATAFRPE